MNEWSAWIEMDHINSWQQLLDDFGVYQIRAVSPVGEPIPIHRFVGIDPIGLLYVGRSGYRLKSPRRTVAKRIREFVNQHHAGGKTYAKANTVLQQRPPFVGHRLQVRAQFLPDEHIAAAEAELLDKYFSMHAELPPCNAQSSNLRERERMDTGL